MIAKKMGSSGPATRWDSGRQGEVKTGMNTLGLKAPASTSEPVARHESQGEHDTFRARNLN